jgi:thiamine transport system ATP-binding protein
MILLVDALRRKRPVTILMTIHTPEDVADVADQMAFVAGGRVVASGRPADVLNSGLAPRIAAAVSDS